MTLSRDIIESIYWADDSNRRILTLIMLFPEDRNAIEAMATLGEGENAFGLINQLRRRKIVDLKKISIADEYKQLLEALFAETYKSLPTPSLSSQLKALFNEDGTLSRQAVQVFESLTAEKPEPQPFFGRSEPYYRFDESRLCLFPLEKSPQDALIGAQAVLTAKLLSENSLRDSRFIPILIAPRIPADMLEFATALNVELYLMDAVALLQLRNLTDSVSIDTLRQMSSRLRDALLNQPAAGLWNIDAAWDHLVAVPSGATS